MIDISVTEPSYSAIKSKRLRIIFTLFCVLPVLPLGAWAKVDQPLTIEGGRQLYSAKQYPEAISLLEQIARLHPKDTPAYREAAELIGQSYFMMAQAPKAIPWLEQVTGSNEASYMLGYAYFLNHQPDESRTAFARLFGLKPDSAAAHLLTGQMLLKKEYEVEATAEVKKALALNPSIPEAHFLLGEMAIYGGRSEEGLDEMTKELELNPNFAMAWYRLGDAYTRLDRWDDAIPQLQRAIWLNQTNSGPYILLGKCYFKIKSYPNAEGMLRRALALDPQNYSGNYLLAQTLTAEGKSDEAKPLLEKLKTMERR